MSEYKQDQIGHVMTVDDGFPFCTTTVEVISSPTFFHPKVRLSMRLGTRIAVFDSFGPEEVTQLISFLTTALSRITDGEQERRAAG